MVVDEQRVAEYRNALLQVIESGRCQIKWQYMIPELGEGGTCSLFGQLQKEPFDLKLYLSSSKTTEHSLGIVSAVVDFVEQQQLVDWFGIYQLRKVDAQQQLLKLAYFGKPSRPLFPVNLEYAQISNNAHVALHGHPRVINDVSQYVLDGGEYYTCDPKVQSELCFPFFAKDGSVLGIIDAESFNTEAFDKDAMSLFTAICEVLPGNLPE